jgi:hypothetical protein
MWFTRRAFGLHVTVLVVVPTFLALGWWQFNRATSGNDLSWAYTFEWPVFAAYAVFMWWKLVHDWPVRDDGQDQAATPGVGSALPARVLHPVSTDTATSGATDVDETAGGHPVRTAATMAVEAPSDDENLDMDMDRDPDAHLEVEEDEELRAYNEYLAALNASDRRKTW